MALVGVNILDMENDDAVLGMAASRVHDANLNAALEGQEGRPQWKRIRKYNEVDGAPLMYFIKKE